MEIKRNLKSLKNKTGAKIINAIKGIEATHDKYQGCYHWTQTGNASGRRGQEFDNDYSFIFNGVKYDINQSLSVSCKNFYYRLHIEKGGKKSNIRAIRALIN